VCATNLHGNGLQLGAGSRGRRSDDDGRVLHCVLCIKRLVKRTKSVMSVENQALK
jgi:hypothetical protein